MDKPDQSFSFQSKEIPTSPGCYLFLNKEGVILYVGKAKNIRKRVSSYFQKNKKSPKTASLVKKIQKIETRVVKTEMEALILENNLIKEHQPRYNILLRDDKNFLYLRITNETFPRLEITRRIVRDGSFYLGPKTSAKRFRETIAFCQKVFQIRTCKLEFSKLKPGLKKIQIKSNPESRKILCLDFHIKKCSGPCAGHISPSEYQADIQRMKKFLRGDTKEVIRNLQKKMMTAAKEKNFEQAAKTRDLIQSIEVSTLKQTVQFADLTNRDFVSFVRDGRSIFFVRIAFRNGKFLDLNEVQFRAEYFATDGEVLEQFLLQFYERVDEIPAEIYIPNEVENDEDLAMVLSDKFGKSLVKIIVPQRGEKKQALEIAQKNAQKFADQSRIKDLSQAENFSKALPELATALGMKEPPRRIECYDISHFSGTKTVASQVVFIDGKSKKSEYRRFHIKSLKLGEIDDFKSMAEVLGRRFEGLKRELQAKSIGNIEIKQILKKKKKREALTFAYDIFKSELQFPLETTEEDFGSQNVFLGLYKYGDFIGMIKGGVFNKTLWQIHDIAIVRIERNKGYGRLLLEKFEEFVLEKEGKRLFVLPDKSALNFYTQTGFSLASKVSKKVEKYIGEMKEKYGGTDTIFECYEKKISQKKEEESGIPDLIVIDGGKGQLSAALKVIPKEFHAQVIALAKREEEVFVPGKSDPIELPKDSAASKLLQRLRDEAHRFAISFNRNLRSKALVKSALDEISGIGPSTKKKLLKEFGSVSGIRKASDEDLKKILNVKQFSNVRKNL